MSSTKPDQLNFRARPNFSNRWRFRELKGVRLSNP